MTTNTNQQVKKENTNAVAQNPAQLIKIGFIILLIQPKEQINPLQKKLDKTGYALFIMPLNKTSDKRPLQEPTYIMTPEEAAKILGVSKFARDVEITKAYHKLCKQWHPDTNPDKETAKRKMQQINDAYNVMLQYVNNRRTIQPRPAVPAYESPVQKALKKLRDAVKQQEQADKQFKQATENKNKIFEEYQKTPKNDPKKQKLFAELQKAYALLDQCANKMRQADEHLRKCVKEYDFSFRIKNQNVIQQQHTYQRAA